MHLEKRRENVISFSPGSVKRAANEIRTLPLCVRLEPIMARFESYFAVIFANIRRADISL